MKGQQLNTICKTIKVFTHICQITGNVSAIDQGHVMMLNIRPINNEAVFEVITKGALDVSLILRMKIDKNAEFDVRLNDTEDELTLVGENTTYTFPILDSEAAEVLSRKVDFMALPRNEYILDTKTLEKAVNNAEWISERAIFECRDDGLHVVSLNDGDGSKCDTRVSTGRAEYPGARSIFCPDYISTALRGEVPKKITLYVGKNHPLTMRWADEWNLYEVHIAPCIIEED